MIVISNPANFKQAIRLARKISPEPGFVIGNNKLIISALAPSSIALMELTAPFEAELEVKPFCLKNIQSLESILPSTGEVSINIEQNRVKLDIVSNRRKSLELSIAPYDPPNINYNPSNYFVIDSAELKDLLDELDSISPYAKFVLSPEGVNIVAESDESKYQTEVPILEHNIVESFYFYIDWRSLKAVEGIKGNLTMRITPSKPLWVDFEHLDYKGRLLVAQSAE